MHDSGSEPERSIMYQSLDNIDHNPFKLTSKPTRHSNADTDQAITPGDEDNRLSVTSARSSSHSSPTTRVSARPAMSSRIPLPTTTASPVSLTNTANQARNAGQRQSNPPPPSRQAPVFSSRVSETSSPALATAANADVQKPLPSPPVAQIINPLSPPKASRTLVDATVSGTPTDEDWPIIAPENDFSPVFRNPFHRRSQPLSANNPYAKYVTGYHSSEDISPLDVGDDSDNTPASILRSRSADVRSPIPGGRRQPHVVRPDSIGRAISTVWDEALESPLAYQYKASGKDATAAGDHVQNDRPGFSRRGFNVGSPSWPLLDAFGPHRPEQTDNAQTEHPTHLTPTPPPRSAVLTQQGANMYGVVTSSKISSGTSSSDEVQRNRDVVTSCGDRIRNLSSHNLRAGVGPVLRIAGDADAVIMGGSAFVPAVPGRPGTSSQPSLGVLSPADGLARVPPTRATQPSSGVGSMKEPMRETGRVGLKKSIRNFFQKRDKTTEPNLISKTGSALIRRFKSSANLSKQSVADSEAAKAGRTHDPMPIIAGEGGKSHGVKAAIPTLKAFTTSYKEQSTKRPTTSTTPSTGQSAVLSDTPGLINDSIMQANTLPEDPKERSRGLNIAQVILRATETCQQAKIASDEAQKNTREAAMHLENMLNMVRRSGDTVDETLMQRALEFCHSMKEDLEGGGGPSKKK